LTRYKNKFSFFFAFTIDICVTKSQKKSDILAVGVVWLGAVEKTIAKKGSPNGLPFLAV